MSRGQSKRCDCPACGGKHSFSASNDAGKLKWFCFKASCNIKGIHSKEVTLDEAKKLIKSKAAEPLKLVDFKHWTSNILSSRKACQFILANNCAQAFEANPGNFFYDIIKERLVFAKFSGPNYVSFATGRSLNGMLPKWYKYITLDYYKTRAMLEHPHKYPLYIVEDCASACSISRIGNGLALCGTTWDIAKLTEAIAEWEVEDVIVCLDADAQEKAHRLSKDLQGFGKFKSVKVLQLSDDAKYLEEEQLKKEINNV